MIEIPPIKAINPLATNFDEFDWRITSISVYILKITPSK
jgi:hypothetical protein